MLTDINLVVRDLVLSHAFYTELIERRVHHMPGSDEPQAWLTVTDQHL
jgi:catechol-2,3-dioxygenase